MPMWASDEGGEVRICWKVGGTDVSIFWFFFPPVSARYEGKEAIPVVKLHQLLGIRFLLMLLLGNIFSI